MDIVPSDRGIFLFGPFRLDPAPRALWRDGARVFVPAPLFDALLYLVEHADREVEGNELAEAAWRGLAAEAPSLDDTIAALRKLLDTDERGESTIATVARSGYRFVAPVRFQPAQPAEMRGGLFDETGALVQGPMVLEPSPPWWRHRWVARGAMAAAAIAVGLVLLRVLPMPGGFQPPPQSIAVLAFTSANGVPREQAIADSVSADLIASLSAVQGLTVAAPAASLATKSGDVAVAGIARRLGVGAVLEGNVMLYGQRVRILARLSDGVTGKPYWTRSYDRTQDKVQATEQQIATDATASLHGARLPGPG